MGNYTNFDLHEVISNWVAALPEDEYQWLKSDDISQEEILEEITNFF